MGIWDCKRILGWALSIALAARCLFGYHGFPPPTYQSGWVTMSSVNESSSYREFDHYLGDLPALVKVYVKAVDGANKDYIFEAMGSQQIDDDEGEPRGGVVFTFSVRKVYVWVFTGANDGEKHYAIMIDGQWGSGQYHQHSTECQVQVRAWAAEDFYEPSYRSELFEMSSSDYKEIPVNVGRLPDLVVVKAYLDDDGVRYHFYGTGSQQVDHDQLSYYSQGGAILFAYNDKVVRLWASSETALFTTDDGLGHDQKIIFNIEVVTVQVIVWYALRPLRPSYDSGWIDSQPSTPFSEFTYPPCATERHVDVQALAVDGNNKGFHFRGAGMAQGGGMNYDAGGGVVFAHTDSSVRIWRLNNDDPSELGLITVKDWGGSNNQQVSPDGKIRVQVWCGSTTWTPRARSESHCAPFKPVPLNDSPETASELLESVKAVDSSHECAILCNKEDACLGFSQDSSNCHLFGELQFGHFDGSREEVAEYEIDHTAYACDACT